MINAECVYVMVVLLAAIHSEIRIWREHRFLWVFIIQTYGVLCQLHQGSWWHRPTLGDERLSKVTDCPLPHWQTCVMLVLVWCDLDPPEVLQRVKSLLQLIIPTTLARQLGDINRTQFQPWKVATKVIKNFVQTSMGAEIRHTRYSIRPTW